MHVSIAESGRLAEHISQVRKTSKSLRPFAVLAIYFLMFAALEWATSVFNVFPAVGYWYLPAGLSFALIASYGPAYLPAVFLALTGANFLLHPLPIKLPHLIALTTSAALAYLLAAIIVRYRLAEPYVSLRNRNEVARLLLGGAFAAVALASVNAANLALAGLIDWKEVMPAFFGGVAGNTSGIFLLTPFLMLHGVPRIEAWLQQISGAGAQSSEHAAPSIVRKPVLLAAIIFLALIATVLWLIFGLGVTSDLQLFFLFSLPPILIGLRRGLEGVTATIVVMAGAVMTMQWERGVGADAMMRYQVIMLASSFNALLFGAGISEIKAAAELMRRRDSILDAVSFAAESFLGKTGWESGIHEVLRRLGHTAGVSRVYIVDNRFTQKGGDTAPAPMHEWAIPSASPDEHNSKVLNILRGQLIEEQAISLSRGQPALLFTKDISLKKREILEALDIRSMVIVPMFVEKQWWGCVGLEQCFVDRAWPESDIEGLKTAGQILGTLLASVRVEQQFRQLTGNVQAVFWISSPDGARKNYVSPAYEEIWGRSCASIHRSPDSWLQAIHPEDHGRVKEALVKQVWAEYDEEYRVIRPDGSIRWVRDRAFPVRDQSGHVYRIVGIAEDITKHKKVEQQLRATTVLLSSLIDNLQSGILVEDESRRITHVNQAFSVMFSMRVPTHSFLGVDSRLLFSQPESFGDRIEEIIERGAPLVAEELHLKDRILRRSYIPLSIGEEYRCHLWQYIDVTDSRRAEEQIKTSLNEKDVLLKEIHHRVKNNLQIISSLLNLQAHQIADPDALQTFRESQDRVKAMALIHERLYQTGDFAKIDFAGYVRNLTAQLLRSYKVNSNLIRLSLEVDPVPMNFDMAIPCALIIHELVSNSLKYAFGSDQSGQIWIRFSEDGHKMLRLTVRDNGRGLPEKMDFENSQSLGLKLVRSLTQQLDGNITYRNNGGFECDICIPRSKSNGSPSREKAKDDEQAPAYSHC